MKYAVIADVHGNLMALQAAMTDAKAEGAERFLFLGDYCVSAPWPDEVVERIRAEERATVIRGNEERYLKLPDGEDAQFAVSRWAGRQISEENRAYLEGLPERADFVSDGVQIHMAHGSRAFIEDGEEKYFSTAKLPVRYRGRAKISREEFLTDVRQTLEGDRALRERIKGLEPGAYLFGHTHIQWHAWIEGRLLLNPGSCGLNLDGGEFGAPYTLLTAENGRISVEERRVEYDRDELIARVKASGQHEAAPVWSEIVFEEWRGGWEKINFFLPFAERFAQEIGDVRRPFARDTWEAAYEKWKKENG